MTQAKFAVHVIFKPNCGLENTRAALILRRVSSLCETLSCYPPSVKSDFHSIPYLRDNGFYFFFTAPVPEQILLVVKASFFVESCTLVDISEAVIPPYGGLAQCDVDSAETVPEASLGLVFNERDEGREDELVILLEKFENNQRRIKLYLENEKHERALEDIAFSLTHSIDAFRTAVARSRVDSFSRIVPSLRTLVEEYGSRVGVLANLVIADERIFVDRSVLSSMEETIRRIIRLYLQCNADAYKGKGITEKRELTTISVSVSYCSSEIVCRIEHDGCSLDIRSAGVAAHERGLLVRPLDTYTEEEIGRIILMPHFAIASNVEEESFLGGIGGLSAHLRNIGARGSVCKTKQGTTEIAIRFPVPFTVLDAVVLRTGSTLFALPIKEIEHFELYRESRISEESFGDGSFAYCAEDGKRRALLNSPSSVTPFSTERPTTVVFLELDGTKGALIVDEARGEESVTVHHLPKLLNRESMRRLGCSGYALFSDGTIRTVLNMRHLLDVLVAKGEADA